MTDRGLTQMDPKIREAQKRILNVFSKKAKDFALAGGTALELYHLHHRFSWDLDFFSPKYDLSEIDRLVSAFKKHVDKRIKLESELMAGGRAKVRFHSMPVKGASRPLKIDFVEDILFKKPRVETKEGVRVYSAKNIYFQKIAAISGMREDIDQVGRPRYQGRDEPRDAYDIYMLSTKIQPLHKFLLTVSAPYQKGVVHWYRTFSRQDLKLGLLDIDIYDSQFDSSKMIAYLEAEIRQFAKEIIGE